MTFTYAVVGHNEEESLAVALGQAFEAARPGDRVWFVDSASTDDSTRIAAGLGAEVVSAPLGKGQAVEHALAQCRGGRLCLLDADLVRSSRNIAIALRDSALETGAQMVIGSFTEPGRRRSVTPAIYRPLIGALFPEIAALHEPTALSGFRVISVAAVGGALPHGYGLETHLNVTLALAGRTVAVTDLGIFEGNLRAYANVPVIGRDVARALLDLAVEHGRLTPELRPLWEDWVEEALALIESQPPPGAPDEEYLERLDAICARPLPPASESVA